MIRLVLVVLSVCWFFDLCFGLYVVCLALPTNKNAPGSFRLATGARQTKEDSPLDAKTQLTTKAYRAAIEDDLVLQALWREIGKLEDEANSALAEGRVKEGMALLDRRRRLTNVHASACQAARQVACG
jgi:hypothetical protein